MVRLPVLAAQGIAETEDRDSEYPHYFKLSNSPPGRQHGLTATDGPGLEAELEAVRSGAAMFDLSTCGLLRVTGDRAGASLQQILTSDVGALEPGQCQTAFILDHDARLMDDVSVLRDDSNAGGHEVRDRRADPYP